MGKCSLGLPSLNKDFIIIIIIIKFKHQDLENKFHSSHDGNGFVETVFTHKCM